MGYVNTNLRRPWLVVDVETTAIPDVATFIGVHPDDAPKTHTKPDTIAKWVKEEEARRIDKAAVDIDLAQIVCTGLWASDQDAPTIWTGDTEEAEREQLGVFWRAYQNIVTERGGLLVGYNILGFDLPLLMRRSQYLCVPHEWIELNKYRPGAVLDVLNELSFAGAKPFRPLPFYAKRFGIDIPDPTTGKDMPALIAAGEWDAVRAHNLADLQRTQALAARLGYIASVASVPAVQEVA